MIRPLMERLGQIVTPRRAPQCELDEFSLWVYPRREVNRGGHRSPVLLMFHEWAAGGISGLTYVGLFWVEGNVGLSSDEQSKLESDLLIVFEDHKAVAILIARGKLRRVGTLPSDMLDDCPATSVDLGAWA
jgi:hypothetical protein